MALQMFSSDLELNLTLFSFIPSVDQNFFFFLFSILDNYIHTTHFKLCFNNFCVLKGGLGGRLWTRGVQSFKCPFC